MDPVFGPPLLVFLVIWYVLWRFGGDLWSLAALITAKTLDGAATAASHAGKNRTAAAIQQKAVAGASWLRDHRRSITNPRTHSGQRIFERLGNLFRTRPTDMRIARAVAAGTGAFVCWICVVYIDAAAAARSARQRRHKPRTRHNWWSLPDWLRWPAGDDPEAPIKAHATRLDREPDITPAVAQPATPALDATSVVDAEIVDDPTPIAPAPQLAITNGRNNNVSSYTAEGALDAWIEHSSHMATECGNAKDSAETTMAGFVGSGWTGVVVETYQNAMEHLQAAADEFDRANTAFTAALSVREAYNANDHAGEKESVLN